MPQYDNTNSGFIGKNNRMREGKKDPEITGSANVDGVEYWVKGWKNAKGYGIKFQRKEASGSRAPAPSPAPAPANDGFDDEIPF